MLPLSAEWNDATVDECAVELGVSDGTVRRMLRDSALMAYRVAGKVRITRVSIDRLKAEHAIPASEFAGPGRVA